jgi:hypothetical protein
MTVALATSLIYVPFLLAIAGAFAWMRWFRTGIGEPPVKESMLRGPGESLRKVIATLNEKQTEDIFLISSVPAMLAAPTGKARPRGMLVQSFSGGSSRCAVRLSSGGRAARSCGG